jgi:SAM-dependent MidA family methyltransferase
VIPWPQAWQDALYGAHGFYRRAEGPAGHFTTSTHGPLGAVFAEALAALCDRHGLTRVVDVGAGRGELLSHLYAVRPDLVLTGVDVVDRPTSLSPGIGWIVSPGGQALPAEMAGLRQTLVVAHEWLDVVPCPVLEVDDEKELRPVLVDPATGQESLGDAVDIDTPCRAWLTQWWPADLEPGDRVEVGLPRDEAWRALTGRVEHGLVLAVDYGHTRATRARTGTLAGYRAGRAVVPVPDGSCDVTADVAVDSLGGDELLRQRDAIAALGIRAPRPRPEDAHGDPAAYLRALSRSGTLAELTRPGGLGDFWWVLTHRGERD